MLKDIAGIRLRGANFKKESDLLLFDSTKKNDIVRGTLLYGRNGAGKSTIAKAVRKARGESQNTIENAEFLDNNNSPITLTDDEKSHIFVFDEEYVDKNVKFCESGLNTIIMLGSQAEIDNELHIEQEKLKEIEEDLDKQKTLVKRIEDNKNKYKKEMATALKGDYNWSGRDKLIKGNKQNTRVSDNTYKNFIHLTTAKTRDQLIIEFSETLNSLHIAQRGDAAISTKVPSLSKEYNEENILKLLKTKIEKPQLSNREKYLLKLVQTGETCQLDNMISTFSNDNVNECPMCMQPVSKEYKLDLIKSIQKVLNKTVEKHLSELEKCKTQEINIDFSPFYKLTPSVDLCSKLLSKINSIINNNNLVIQNKINNPYDPCLNKFQSISNLLSQFKVALEMLEKDRVNYNKKVTDTNSIKKCLNEINNSIAHLDINDYYLKYMEYKNILEIEEEELQKKESEHINTKHRINELKAMQRNATVALSIINRNLSYIFFSEDRLSIEYLDDNYILFSNGNPVHPSQISQGERNIIGLCYYFTNILQNKSKDTGYEQEYLLIIDDPVSSFDIENKVGIMSFLRYQLGKFLLKNEYTKTIIMTHDLLTYYDSDKIFRELAIEFKDKYNKKFKYKQCELKNKELIEMDFNKRQEYTKLMEIIYKFASGNDNKYNLVIGNIMRQVLEAFSTFQYKQGFETVSTNENILKLLPNNIFKNYFKNLMYRLVLNNGSHKFEQTVSMSDMNFSSVISDSEKKRTAKDILCFIYLLNKEHILAHLSDIRIKEKENVESKLTEWCNDIELRGR